MDDSTPATNIVPDKPLYLMQGSPLVAGGKARLMSNRKVKPNKAKPRDVTGPETIGYTTEPRKALKGEPETASGSWVDAQAELAAKYDRMRLERQAEDAREARKSLTIENRMADAHRRAKLQHVDVGHEMHVMRKMLARDKRTDASCRLELLEARLDGVPVDQAA